MKKVFLQGDMRLLLACSNALGPGMPCCTILNCISEGIFAIGLDKKISFLNHAAESITGFTYEEAIGQYCFYILRSNVCQVNCPLEVAIKKREAVYDQAAVIINKSGNEIPVRLNVDIIKDDHGEITGAIETFRDVSLVETLRQGLLSKYRLGVFISKNYIMQEIFEILPDIAESDSTILIQGPSGSGKEMLANTIHELSTRKNKPLIKVNCAAIPDTLLESELFGYVKGAFTDAKKDKKGRFSLAHRGTLFLDEIGNTSPTMQAKLLRILEEKEFIPLGGTVPIKVDVRIIAATNIDLERLVQEGKFREDLYYRLNVVKINLPPLKERKDDIPLLIDFFLAKLNAIKSKNIQSVSKEVMDYLMNYDYPGNIRELENILEHAYVLCHEKIIETKHLPKELIMKNQNTNGLNTAITNITPLKLSEMRLIKNALEKYKGNKVLAARELGISRSTLWRKTKLYQLE